MIITSDINYKCSEYTINKYNLLSDVTIVICSNNLNNLKKYFFTFAPELFNFPISILIIYDNKNSEDSTLFFNLISNKHCRIIEQNDTKGLSYCRNQSLEYCHTPYLIFIDDDVTITIDTIIKISLEFSINKVQVVGVIIKSQNEPLSLPYFFSSGQKHFLGLHNMYDKNKVPWGATMGLDVNYCNHNNLKFNLKLGRLYSGLQSGDDTTFIYQIQSLGGKVSFLTDCFVIHNIDIRRLNFYYILKRVFWQGRSEVIRNNIKKGIMKEWDRYLKSFEFNTFKRFCFALFYIILLFMGILYQILNYEFINIRFRQYFRKK
jgi:hypothetical protein